MHITKKIIQPNPTRVTSKKSVICPGRNFPIGPILSRNSARLFTPLVAKLLDQFGTIVGIVHRHHQSLAQDVVTVGSPLYPEWTLNVKAQSIREV